MTERERRRAALQRMLARRSYPTLSELRFALAALEGHYVREPQLWKDLRAIGATYEARWTINPKQGSARCQTS